MTIRDAIAAVLREQPGSLSADLVDAVRRLCPGSRDSSIRNLLSEAVGSGRVRADRVGDGGRRKRYWLVGYERGVCGWCDAPATARVIDAHDGGEADACPRHASMECTPC